MTLKSRVTENYGRLIAAARRIVFLTSLIFFRGESGKDLRHILFMGLSLFVYFIPLILGFSWNSLEEHYNALDPPENYVGRSADNRITVEAWGAAVVSVPDHIKTRMYVKDGEWPLWNPYQGLGQPFAAMGEGSPYFPLSILRSMAPYSVSNFFLLANVFLAQIFLFKFLRTLGLRRSSSAFGGIAFALSGAVSFHLARANILDQICMIPVLFWAVANAVRAGTYRRYAVLSLVTALHSMAGFIQIAMLNQFLAVLFGITTILASNFPRRTTLTRLSASAFATAIGFGVCSFYLLPLLDWLTTGVGKNYSFLGFLKLPAANTVAFFFPQIFGPWFAPSWMPAVAGSYSFPDWAVNWDNLYAVVGTSILIISISAAIGTKWETKTLRYHYFFFLISSILLTMRFADIAPASLFNFLPAIGRQSPKHANSIMAFSFVVSAAIAVDQLRNIDVRKAQFVILGTMLYFASLVLSFFGTYLFSLYETGTSARTGSFLLAIGYAGSTVIIVISSFLVFFKSVKEIQQRPRYAHFLLSALICAELMLYVPLGNVEGWFVALRLCISAALLLSALFALGYTKLLRIVSAATFLMTLIAYALLVAVPSVGLPRAFDLSKPPDFMLWLSRNAGVEARSFGIFPDYSVSAKIQDIGTVGPLAPDEFREFVRLVSSDQTYDEYLHTSHFLLTGPWHFDLESYKRSRPIFDWIGLKYFVLDKSRFTQAQIQLLMGLENVSLGYDDSRVSILTSQNTRPKAEFWKSFVEKDSQKSILAALKENPGLISQSLMLEHSDVASADSRRDIASATSVSSPNTVHNAAVTDYSLNRVKVQLPPDSGIGILVLKDIYVKGWRAWVDGKPAKVMRVNGLFRGVEISSPAAQSVVIEYCPATFTAGLLLSFLTGLTTIYFLFYKTLAVEEELLFGEGVRVGRRQKMEIAFVALLTVAVLVGMCEAYFHFPGPVVVIGDHLSYFVSQPL